MCQIEPKTGTRARAKRRRREAKYGAFFPFLPPFPLAYSINRAMINCPAEQDGDTQMQTIDPAELFLLQRQPLILVVASTIDSRKGLTIVQAPQTFEDTNVLWGYNDLCVYTIRRKTVLAVDDVTGVSFYNSAETIGAHGEVATINDIEALIEEPFAFYAQPEYKTADRTGSVPQTREIYAKGSVRPDAEVSE